MARLDGYELGSTHPCLDDVWSVYWCFCCFTGGYSAYRGRVSNPSARVGAFEVELRAVNRYSAGVKTRRRTFLAHHVRKCAGVLEIATRGFLGFWYFYVSTRADTVFRRAWCV